MSGLEDQVVTAGAAALRERELASDGKAGLRVILSNTRVLGIALFASFVSLDRFPNLSNPFDVHL